MAASGLLVSVAEIQQFMGKTGVETPKDTEVITQLIKSITEQIEKLCDRGMLYEERIDSYSIDGSKVRQIKLKAYPVWSLTHVKDGTTEDPAADDIKDNVRFDQDTGIIYYPEGYFTEGWKNVEVKCIAGWDSGLEGKTAPEGLRLAIIDEVCGRYELHMSEPMPAEGVNPFQRSKDLSEKCKQAILPYKRITY